MKIKTNVVESINDNSDESSNAKSEVLCDKEIFRTLEVVREFE